MTPHDSFEPEMLPPPFIPPFDPPGSESPSLPAAPDPPEGSSTDDETSSSESRPDWWPEDWPWPPEPEEPVVIEAPPPIHTWPRLPPDHPYHVPPGYSAPDNLPPGHPGEYYPGMPPYPVVHPVPDEPEGSTGDGSFTSQ
ncbi:hypothetical protein [Crateriforma conspicua]|uniref:Uncharacterized protein n=1 Tax=Crateriforma conspicua TaxID=2527996 RepID=A0A5C6FPI8_9PLAN|nr:hypothetical protein [Crateriforma conspicua]TWU62001.1 hypothetical protein V7x_36920 [Crateriforma conspicua]